MRLAMLALSYPILAPVTAPAFSSEGRHVQHSTEEIALRLSQSASIGHELIRADLDQVIAECSTRGWDGADAQPLSPAAKRAARAFLRRIPPGLPRPSVGAEPDGQITFEWYSAPGRVVSVSVDPAGWLHYAALLGATRRYGTEPYFDTIPEVILEIIHRVMAA